MCGSDCGNIGICGFWNVGVVSVTTGVFVVLAGAVLVVVVDGTTDFVVPLDDAAELL